MSEIVLELIRYEPYKKVKVDLLAQALILSTLATAMFTMTFAEYDPVLAIQAGILMGLIASGFAVAFPLKLMEASSKRVELVMILTSAFVAFMALVIGQSLVGIGFNLLPTSSVPLSFAMLAAVAEEVLFRGLFHNWLKKARNKFLANFGSSIIFTVVHINAYGLGIQFLLPIFVTGALLAWSMDQTRLLSVPILAHIMLNFLATGGFGYLPIMIFGVL